MKLVEKTMQLQASIHSTANSLKCPMDNKKSKKETKRLRKIKEELQDVTKRLGELMLQGSGSVSLSGLQEQVPCNEVSIKVRYSSSY